MAAPPTTQLHESPAAAGLAQYFVFLGRVATLAAIYFAAAKVGLSLAGMHRNVSLVWPPTGIALAALLLFGYRLWPGVALGAFLINASTDVPLATAGGIAVGNTLEALSGAYLLRRFARFCPSFEQVQDVLRFVALAAMLSTTISATIGVASLCLGGSAPWGASMDLWWQWWLGDAMGALVVAPVLLVWGTPPRVRWQPRQVAEAGALLIFLMAASQIIFGGWFTANTMNFTLAFTIFPLVIWAALRFGQPGATAATLLTSGVAIWGTARQVGPFAGTTLTESLLLLQAYMGAVAITALLLAAAITQRRRMEEALRGSETRLAGILGSAMDPIVSVDAAQRIVLFNRAAEQMLGWKAPEILGQPLDRLLPARFREVHAAHIARFGQTGVTTRSMRSPGDLVALRADGQEVPIEATISQVDVDGHKIYTVILRDITGRKQAEAALERANWELTRWASGLEQRTRQVSLLNEMGDLLQSCRTVEEMYAVVIHFAQKLFPAEAGGLGALGASTGLIEVVAVWGESPPGERIFPPENCWALRRGRVHVVEAPGSGLLCQHVDASLSTGYLCVPMMAQGEPVGVLHLQAGPPPLDQPESSREHLREARQQLAVSMAEHIALALANLKLQETLRSQAIRDPLTGLFNRRYMEESLEREVRRAARSRTPLGIMMLDLDHFKRLNDTFGHEAGDTLLTALGTFLRSDIRGSDIACRYGGEEFALILPEASLEATYDRAERLREAVKRLRVPYRGEALGPVTISVGVATYPDHGATGQALVSAADSALYCAKQGGRDQVVVSQ